MNRRNWLAELLGAISLFAFLAAGIVSQAQTPHDTEAAALAFKILNANIEKYLKLQKDVQASLPALKPTKVAAEIAERQRDLARRIALARPGAVQGDIFTPEVTKEFRGIIRREFQGPEGPLARKTIRNDDPQTTVVRLRVNDVYPETEPSTTMPPTLLSKLPQLPKELVYQIVRRDLVLKDAKAGLIVDLIPNAMP